MPVLNRFGDWCSGVAGAGFYYGKIESDLIVTKLNQQQAGGHAWIDDYRCATQRFEGTARLSMYDIRNGTWTDPLIAAVSLVIGSGSSAGVWGTQAVGPQGFGVYASTGLFLAGAGGGERWIGPDGAILVKDDYQSWGPYSVYEKPGVGQEWNDPDLKWTINEEGLYEVNMLGQKRMLYKNRAGELKTIGNIPSPVHISDSWGWIRMKYTTEGWWVMYQDFTTSKLVFHPAGNTTGYVISESGDTFRPDFVQLEDGTLRFIWSINEGEGPQYLRYKDLQFSDARTSLGTAIGGGGSNLIQLVGNGWFPRLNTQGKVAHGFGQMYIEGVKMLEPGYAPKWINEGAVACGGLNDWLYQVTTTGAVTILAQSILANVYGAGGGNWATAQMSHGGREIGVTFDAKNGKKMLLVEYDNSNDDRSVYYDDVEIVSHGSYNEIRCFDGMLMWTEGAVPNKKIWGKDGAGVIRDLTINTGGHIGSPIPIRIDTEAWYLWGTNTDLRMAPWGELSGYGITTGEDMNFNPDAMGLGTVIRVVWNDKNSVGYMQDFDTSQPRSDLSGAVIGTPSVDPTGSSDMILTSSATFAVADATVAIAEVEALIPPAWPLEMGRGRLVHPTIGAFDYEVKPDEWVNIDGDAIIPPVWASNRTMKGATNVLWPGYLKDVVVEERWKALGGLAMPMTMLRMLVLMWTNPVDPAVGYVQWYPSYISPVGFKVIPFGLQVGTGGITLDDVANYKTWEGDPDGWVTNPVTLSMKVVERL